MKKMVLRIPMMKEAFHVNWQAYEAFIITISVKNDNKNPAQLVRMPKKHEKTITRLDVDEVAMLLDEVESGEN